MDPNVLERLLTDRAVGQLDDDAAQLLEAYLAMDASAAAAARQIAATVALARRAMEAAPALPVPESAARRLRQAARSRRTLATLLRTAALAACLLLGLFLGALLAPAGPAGTSPPGPATAPNPSALASDQPHRLVWKSPVEYPTLRGDL